MPRDSNNEPKYLLQTFNIIIIYYYPSALTLMLYVSLSLSRASAICLSLSHTLYTHEYLMNKN